MSRVGSIITLPRKLRWPCNFLKCSSADRVGARLFAPSTLQAIVKSDQPTRSWHTWAVECYALSNIYRRPDGVTRLNSPCAFSTVGSEPTEPVALDEDAKNIVSDLLVTDDATSVVKDNVTEMDSDQTTIIELERELYKQQQEPHMNALAISNLPEDIGDEELREEIQKHFKLIGVGTKNKSIREVKRIQPGWVYCELGDRNSVNYVLSCAFKRFNVARSTGVYVNQSLCDNYMEIFYHTRSLKRQKKVKMTNVRSGTVRIQLLGSKEWIDVTHMDDLFKLGLLERETSDL